MHMHRPYQTEPFSLLTGKMNTCLWTDSQCHKDFLSISVSGYSCINAISITEINSRNAEITFKGH